MALTWGLIGLVLAAGPAEGQAAFVPLLSQQDAWKTLPALQQGEQAPLPRWALATAKPLPRTTAAMLELDCRHRITSPLDAMLRAKVRLIVARANACRYTEAEATADLRRAGLNDAGLTALAGKSEGLPAEDRDVLVFARKLTAASQTVTDDEVAGLIKRYGERQLVALVQHIAYGNFQDRLLLALGLAQHVEAPLPAMEVGFVRPQLGARLAQPRRLPLPMGFAPFVFKKDPEWLSLDLEDLRKEVECQKSRRPRIGLSVAEHDGVVHWGEVCRKHQPEQAGAWSFCMRVFGAESFQDPIIEASVLWVVTRTQRSFY